jgi:DNA-binding protein HU-beta
MANAASNPIMNKDAIITAMAAKTGTTKAESERHFSALLDSVTEGLKAGNDVRLVGVGTLKTKMVAARAGRNVRTQESIQIPAHTEVKFSVSAELKAAVRGEEAAA